MNCRTCFPSMRRERQEGIGERWCFGCRKRRQFVWYLLVDNAPMSYYEPLPIVSCGTCDLTDGDLFPGRFREYA